MRLNLVLKSACSGKQHMLSSQAESEDKGIHCNDKIRGEYDQSCHNYDKETDQRLREETIQNKDIHS